MRRALIGQQLWDELAPLVPEVPRSAKGGRPRLEDVAVLNGILFVLYTGITWGDLPQELGYGSGMSCWRRLQAWQSSPASGSDCTICC